MPNVKNIKVSNTSYSVYDVDAHTKITQLSTSMNQKITQLSTSMNQKIEDLQHDLDAETSARTQAVKKLENAVAALEKQTATYANVKEYGAKGDGSTDDTAAIKTAIASGLDLYFPKGTYKITQAVSLGCPLMADGAVLLASGVTVTMEAPLASCKLHFKRASGGKYNITAGQIIGDWFIDTGLADVFDGGSIANFTGTIVFPSPGTWGAANNAVTTNTKYHVTGKLLIASHVTYDFCGGVVSFDTNNAQISATGIWGGAGPERSKVCNATFCATVETVAQFTQVSGCGRITFENLHCIGGRRVGYYKHTVNMQVSNIVHDCFYNSSEGYCSFVLDETSGGVSGISGNASIRFYNCISSMSSLSGDSSQFIIYNSNDIRDIFIDDCECASPHYGIQINSSGTVVTAWNIFIRNYVADQCIRCIYCTNLGRAQVTIDSCYFNAHDRCVEFINSAGTVTNCQFIGDQESLGIAVTDSQGVIITGNMFQSIDHPIVCSGGSDCQIGFNTVNRRAMWVNDCAFKFLGTSNGNRVVCNSIIPPTSDKYYTAAFRFESTCSGNIIGLNRVTGTELSNEEADLVKVSTTKV